MTIEMRSWMVGLVALFAASGLVLSGCGTESEVQVNEGERPSLTDVDLDNFDADEDAHSHDDAEADGAAVVPADYPLTTCVVSGEELGSHGEPYPHEVNGETVWLCCSPCSGDVDDDPEHYLQLIAEAREG